MNKSIHNHLLLSTALLLGLTGCSDLKVFDAQPDTTRFYILDSSGGPYQDNDSSATGLSILVGPSSVAKYLNQPRIVTITGPNLLDYSDAHRWGEPLDEGINRIAISNIGQSLNTSRIGFSRLMSGLSIDWDYKVGYHIYQLGGDFRDGPQMQVTWWISAEDGQEWKVEGAVYKAALTSGSNDYRAYVNAIEEIIIRWSFDVAETIRDLDKAAQ